MADATTEQPSSPSTKSSTKTTPHIIHPRRVPFEHGLFLHTEAHLHRPHLDPTLPQANPIPPSRLARPVRGPPNPARPRAAHRRHDRRRPLLQLRYEAGGGVDVCVLILFLYVQSFKRLLPRMHKDSAAVADMWPSTSSFDGYLSALSPLQVVAYTGNDDSRKFVLDGDLTLRSIKSFAEEFLEDKHKPFYKSDPIPETNDGDVKIVVGNNFDEIVLDESKDVLLKIYAPWCGHCQALEPIYNKLGKHLRGIDSLVIAKMDGVTNEHPRATMASWLSNCVLVQQGAYFRCYIQSFHQVFSSLQSSSPQSNAGHPRQEEKIHKKLLSCGLTRRFEPASIV